MKRSKFTQARSVAAVLESLESRTLMSAVSGVAKDVVTVAATGAQAMENGSQAGEFTLTRTGPTDTDLVVKVSMSGTARAGKDYVKCTKSYTILAGDTSVTIPVAAIQDSLIEGAETVILKVGSSKAYTVGAAKAATVNMIDDDNPTVTVKATKPNAAEANGKGKGHKDGQFTVYRNVATREALTVNFNLDGTALAGTDYTDILSVVIPAGKKSVTVPVKVTNDRIVEGPETVIMTLTGGANQIVGGMSAATVNIADGTGPWVGAQKITMPLAQYFPLNDGSITNYTGTVNGQAATMNMSVSQDGGSYRMNLDSLLSDGTGMGTDFWFTPDITAGLRLTKSDNYTYVLQDGQPALINNPVPLGIAPGLLVIPVSVEGLQSYSGSATRDNGDQSSVQVFWMGGESVDVNGSAVDCIKLQVNINWNEGNGVIKGSGENLTLWLAQDIGVVKMTDVQSSWDGPSSQNPTRTITNSASFTLTNLPIVQAD